MIRRKMSLQIYLERMKMIRMSLRIYLVLMKMKRWIRRRICRLIYWAGNLKSKIWMICLGYRMKKTLKI